MAKKNTGPQAFRNPCDSKPRRPGQVAVLEDQDADAECGGRGEEVREDTDESDQRRLQRDEEQEEPEARARRTKTGSVFDESALFEVVILRGRPTDERARVEDSPRSRSIVAPTAVSDGSVVGVAVRRARASLAPATPTAAIPGSSASTDSASARSL